MRQRRKVGLLGLVLAVQAALLAAGAAPAAAAVILRPAGPRVILPLNEQVIRVPLTVTRGSETRSLTLEATLYLPEGSGPFPLVVLNHGSPRDPATRATRVRFEAPSWEFVQMGFAVVIPMRRGFGHSEGDYAEEEGYCERSLFYEAGMESAKDVLATVRFMSSKPFIDAQRIVLAGHSTGGFAALAAASQGFPGLRGVINFAGGRGSMKEKQCSPPNLVEACRRFGAATRVPTLWLYAENDTYFPPWLAREMFQGYRETGGRGQLLIFPPFGEEGHFLFTDGGGLALWAPVVSRFLREIELMRMAAPIP